MNDYKEKYMLAMERAKNFIENGDERERTIAESIFAGIMEESEDERIRKALKEYFINSFQNNGAAAICGVHIKDILAWLEKQGEKGTKRNNGEIPNFAWSEEDTQYINDTLALLSFGVSTHSVGEVQEWLQSLNNRVQLKQEWSEEDETTLNDIIMCGERHCYLDAGNIAWLKNLKNRLLPQPKQDSTDRFFEGFKKGEQSVIENYGKYGLCKPTKWSEDDERLFQIVIDILDRENHLGNISNTDLIACVRKLKFLRPQSNWKPSVTDIKVLEEVIDLHVNPINYSATLHVILEQLKKLRNE